MWFDWAMHSWIRRSSWVVMPSMLRLLPVRLVQRVQGGRQLDQATLRAAPRLRLVCITATGFNNIDVETARELGIVVSNVVAYATDGVAQHVFALMLAHHTRLFDYTAAVKRGDWSRSPQFCLLDYPVRELSLMTLGIVGLGHHEFVQRGRHETILAFGEVLLGPLQNAD